MRSTLVLLFLCVNFFQENDLCPDLFWGMWSLQFNLKTDRYKDRVVDAYGRDRVEEEMFRTIAAAEVFG